MRTTINAIRKALPRALSFCIIAAVGVFFFRAFRANWSTLRAQPPEPDVRLLLLAFCSFLATYLLTTYAWLLTINALSRGPGLSFPQGIAAFNTSNLTKYLPGKIWSYALQMYWLGHAGISKSAVLSANLVNLSVSLVTSLIAGFACLLFAPGMLPQTVTAAVLALLIVFDVSFILFQAVLLRTILALFNRIVRRDVVSLAVPQRVILVLHLVHFAVAGLFGIGAYLLCIGTGPAAGSGGMLHVAASLLLADVIGFLAVIVPGGLGVREGAMYLMLQTASSRSAALIVPVAARAMSMCIELLLGAAGFLLLRRLQRARSGDKRPAES